MALPSSFILSPINIFQLLLFTSNKSLPDVILSSLINNPVGNRDDMSSLKNFIFNFVIINCKSAFSIGRNDIFKSLILKLSKFILFFKS